MSKVESVDAQVSDLGAGQNPSRKLMDPLGPMPTPSTHDTPMLVSVNDRSVVVFCIVQPRGLYHAHLVHTIQRSGTAREHKFRISNIKGRINGHCFIEHIYGKLVLVVE